MHISPINNYNFTDSPKLKSPRQNFQKNPSFNGLERLYIDKDIKASPKQCERILKAIKNSENFKKLCEATRVMINIVYDQCYYNRTYTAYGSSIAVFSKSKKDDEILREWIPRFNDTDLPHSEYWSKFLDRLAESFEYGFDNGCKNALEKLKAYNLEQSKLAKIKKENAIKEKIRLEEVAKNNDLENEILTQFK